MCACGADFPACSTPMRLRSARQCGICLETINNAVHGDGCQHPFCRPCLERWSTQGWQARCPLCRAPFAKLQTLQGLHCSTVAVPRPAVVVLHFMDESSAAPPVQLSLHLSWKDEPSNVAYVLRHFSLEAAKQLFEAPMPTEAPRAAQ